MVLFLFFSCKKSDNKSDDPGHGIGYEYWVGAIPNSYYEFNIFGEKGLQVKGKPFMVLTYNRTTGDYLDCEIGLSEVTQTNITTPSGIWVPPDPTLDASVIDFKDKLGLKSPVDLMVGWNSTYDSTKTAITNGLKNFSFRANYSIGFGGGYNEEWKFSYVSNIMTGGVKNLDMNNYMGRESENNAFNLIPK
jgi:hypothetical protein